MHKSISMSIFLVLRQIKPLMRQIIWRIIEYATNKR
jgi:hypothetical protein